MLKTYIKQHGDDLTEIGLCHGGSLVATITVSQGWVDITYEQTVSTVGSYELLRIDNTGAVIIDKPTIA